MSKTINEWLAVCDNLLSTNGLRGWHTETFGGKTTVGLCVPSQRLIKLSKKMLEVSPDAYIMDTIYHEVAHALTPGHRHDAVWKATAQGLGGSGEQYSDREEYSKFDSKWVGICMCDSATPFFRFGFKRVYSCNKCSSPLYIRRRDGETTKLPGSYVKFFNNVAKSRGFPKVNGTGEPLP